MSIDIDIYVKSAHLCLCTCLLPAPPRLAVNGLKAEFVHLDLGAGPIPAPGLSEAVLHTDCAQSRISNWFVK